MKPERGDNRTAKSLWAAWRMSWRERTVQAALAVVLWWTIYWRVVTAYGLASALIAATCIAWGYLIVSTYAAHVLNARSAGPNQPRGPHSPSGRWPGARP